MKELRITLDEEAFAKIVAGKVASVAILSNAECIDPSGKVAIVVALQDIGWEKMHRLVDDGTIIADKVKSERNK